jgi:YVTN family beta-propeller protein
MIYVANSASGNVTVIDGSTDTVAATVPAGASPSAVAVNPQTNKIYVANSTDDTLTVIDGSTNAVVATPSTGSTPIALAINPVTNTIYVANLDSSSVTVIAGSTNTVTTTVTGVNIPVAVAVNPVTNKIYIANRGGGTSDQVIDGATNTITATVNDSSAVAPAAVAVDPVRNTIYVANNGDGVSNLGNISIINGSTDALITNVADSSANGPHAIAINPVTDIIYVPNSNTNNVTLIDGATNSYFTTLTDTGASLPFAVGINPVTNKVYVANNGSDSTTLIDADTNTLGTPSIGVGGLPLALAANPVTNTIYVANQGSANVSVISGATNAVTAIVSTGTLPAAVAVNPVTNSVYVANGGTNNVTVINGATNSTSTVSDPSAVLPVDVAVNPVTNTIYVANHGTGSGSNGSVTVIDGITGIATDLVDPLAVAPNAVAVNPATDKIYVANNTSDNVTVIDGTTNTVSATIPAGVHPRALAVNSLTNQIYVANQGDGITDFGEITVINGITNAPSTVTDPSANAPYGVGVNPVTNMIYVANYVSSNVTVVNGSTNTYSATVNPPGADASFAVAVDPVTNHMYVSNVGGGVSVIDGVTNFATDVLDPSAMQTQAIIVNPATNTVYAANVETGNVTYFAPERVATIPILSAITPLVGNLTTSPTPSFAFTGINSLTTSPVDGLLYFVDTWQSAWFPAAPSVGGNFSGSTATLQPGFHILYAYSTDGEEGTSVNTGLQSAPLIGSITPYGFLVAVPEAGLTPAFVSFASQAVGTTSASQAFTLTNSGTAPLNITGIGFGGSNPADFHETDNCTSPLVGPGTCTINVTFTPSIVSAENASLTLTDNSGGSSGSQQSVNVSGPGVQANTTTGVISTANPSNLGQAVTFTATVTPQGASTPTGTVTFKDGATPICTAVPLASDQAQCGTSSLTLGSHSITAVYSGDVHFVGSTSPPLSQVVGQAPAITSASSATCTVGALCSFTVTAIGTPLPVIGETGALPNGVNFNTSTGVLSGTPAAGTGGIYTISFTASNGTLPNATQTFTLNVFQPPAITSANNTTFTVGSAGSFTVTVTGFPAPTFIEAGTLPSGVTFNPATGVLSSTTAAGPPGIYPITITAANGIAPNAPQAFTLTLISTQTTTRITGISPNPSIVGQPVTVSYSVTINGLSSAVPGTETVRVTDSTGASCTGTVAAGSCALVPLAVGPDTMTATYSGDGTYSTSQQSVTTAFSIVPTVSLTGLSATASPTLPTSVGVSLNAPTPVQLTGTLTLSFQSTAAGTPANYIDPGTQFAAGGITLNFTIPIGATTATLAQNGAIQQGTTAGSLIVTLTSLVAGSVSVALPQPNPGLSVVVPSIAPSITAGSGTITGLTSSGFNVELDAYSTTRDLISATFTFQAANGTTLNGGNPPPVLLQSIAAVWFSSTSGVQVGSSFHLKVPFTFNGDTSALGTVTVTLTNSVGTSTSTTISFK